LVSGLKVRETGYAYVVDRHGTLIAFRDTARVLKGENVSNLQPISEFIHSPTTARAGVSTYAGITGIMVVGTYVPLGAPDWAVVTELPWSEAYREVIRQAEASFGILLVMAVLASLLGMYLARRLSVPLVNLMETATHIAEGERELQAKVGGPREVASLAMAFNSMTGQLQRSLERLEHQVVEVRQAEQSLRQANGALRALIDYSPLAIIMHDLDNHVLLWNNAAEKMYGWSAQETVGKPVPFLSGRVRDEQRDIHERVTSGEVLTNLELERVRKNGSRILNGVSFAPLRDTSGNVYALVSIATDITERKRAEDALQESEERLRQIASSLREVIWLRDVKTRQILYVNQAFEEMTGWTCDRFYENPDLVIDAVHPDDRELVRKAIRQRGEDVLFDVEHRIVHRNGSVRWVAGRSFPVRNEAGEVFRWASIMEDITERKIAEEALRVSKERFRLLVETTSDWVWEVDRHGVYTYASPRVTDVLGYKSEEILGKTPFDLMPAEEGEALRAEFQRIVDSRRPFARMENKNRHKDGRIIVLETSGVPVFDDRGNLLSYRGIDRDITEYKKSQEEQRRLQEQLQQATKMEAVGQLAGGIAHDFNNLLTAILGNIDLARLDLDPEDSSMKYLDEIGSAARSAASLTRQLLAFARRQIIQPKVFKLNDLVSRFQRVLTRLLGEDIALKINLDRELGSVRVDPGQIEQVLVNLATNARAAMPTGGTLLIETSNIDADREYGTRHVQVRPGRYVRLAVSDTGLGMSPEVKAHLFEPFFTTKPIGQGTGLGLATVFGIVKQAGGAIEASSEEGQGTRFDIYFPRIDETSEEVGRESVASEMPKGSQTILVIEDNESVRTWVVKALEHLGYRVLSPAVVAEVVDFVTSFKDRIDLLMTDVVMPGVTGPELADRLRILRPEMKILFTSGYTQNVIAHHGIVEDDLNFIGKPYTIQALAAKIKEVLTSG
ncbi:MAG TPA: PAS domain S-box protein, partial [Spirochaetia bacterium]|nr:PAS domain S-box protein [Spirochaetia bacterium]